MWGPRLVRTASLSACLFLVGAPRLARGDIDINTPTNMPYGTTITAEDLWKEFDRSLPPNVWVSPLENSRYEVISARWMRTVFLPALKHEMKALWAQKVPQEDSAGNCNGFALLCRLMLSLSAMASHAYAPATATVIVRQEKPFGGLSATMENHCVAYVLTDEGPWIVEVQSGVYTKIADYPNLGTIKMVSVH